MIASPFVMVIFGATGDLAKSKLIPGLFSLYQQNKLPKDFFIVGFARREFSDEEFRNMFEKLVGQEEWNKFSRHIFYQQGVFEEEAGYKTLIKKLEAYDDKMNACIMRIFYLATPPANYEDILDKLAFTKLSEGCGQGSNKWTRIAIEKPFGKDLETARHLDKKLADIFDEKQIFRVDHYLGKETVQNMIAFRFANSIFDPVWNKDYIDHVQITLSEEKGIGSRGKFFEGVGMLRDVGQNHLLQLAASVVMEQPKSFTKDGVRDARAAAMAALRCYEKKEVLENVVRSQYEGYKGEKDVAKDSRTETFVAMKVFFDTKRFSQVPFYLRFGKKLETDFTEISIVFKQTCHILFKEYGCPEVGNILRIRIQPNEGISLRVIAKKPGDTVSLGTVNMEFSYYEEFGGHGGDAYEKLLIDIFAGDQMLFNRSDELDHSWEFITKVLKVWQEQNKSKKFTIPNYKQRTQGSKEAFTLIEKDSRKWL